MQLLFLTLLILTVIIHEIAHGYAALLLGDQTAKNEGRLTLNPIPHIDLFGTIIIPTVLILTGSSLLFGWAKPVPYNPYNLRGRYGEAIVAAAGSLTNIAVAIVFGLIYRFGIGVLPEPLLILCSIVMYINLFLGLFNLIPVPPLDGSKIIMTLLPIQYRTKIEEQFRSITGVKSIALLILALVILSTFLLKYLIMAVSIIALFITGSTVIGI